MPLLSAAFHNWPKSSPNMKLSSNAAFIQIAHEGITSFDSLLDFDKKSILSLPTICKESIPAIPAESSFGIELQSQVSEANIIAIAIQ